MKLIKHIFILLMVSGCSMGGIGSNEIIENLELEGKPYFDQLVFTREYESILNKIENGDEILIGGSRIFAQWVDASTSLSLRFSLSRAIIRSPDSVISLIPDVFSASDLCTIPYIEESIEVELRHINESLSALDRSNDSSESHVECINIYKKIKNDITKSSSGR